MKHGCTCVMKKRHSGPAALPIEAPTRPSSVDGLASLAADDEAL